MTDIRNILMMVAVGVLVLGTVVFAQTEPAGAGPGPWQGGPRWQGRGQRPGPPFARGQQNWRQWAPDQAPVGKGQPNLPERRADRLDLTEAQRQKPREIKEDLGRFGRRMQGQEMRNRRQQPGKGRPGRRMGRGRRMQGRPGWGPGRGFGGPGMGRGPAQQFGQRQRFGQNQGMPRGSRMQGAGGPQRGMGRGSAQRFGQRQGMAGGQRMQGTGGPQRSRRPGNERPARGQGSAGMRGAQRPGSGESPLGRLFERADSNDDGLLSRAEAEAFDSQRRTEGASSAR